MSLILANFDAYYVESLSLIRNKIQTPKFDGNEQIMSHPHYKLV